MWEWPDYPEIPMHKLQHFQLSARFLTPEEREAKMWVRIGYTAEGEVVAVKHGANGYPIPLGDQAVVLYEEPPGPGVRTFCVYPKPSPPRRGDEEFIEGVGLVPLDRRPPDPFAESRFDRHGDVRGSHSYRRH